MSEQPLRGAGESTPYPFTHSVEVRASTLNPAYGEIAQAVTTGQVLTLQEVRDAFHAHDSNAQEFFFYVTSGRFYEATGVPVWCSVQERPSGTGDVVFYHWEHRDDPEIQEAVTQAFKTAKGRGLSAIQTVTLKEKLEEATQGNLFYT